MITIAEIGRARTLISSDEHGTYLSGDFLEVQTSIHLLGEKIEQKHRDIYQNLSQITFDIWNIGTVLARIEWTRKYALEHPDFVEAWRPFVSVDIEHFHVEYRSIFDYVASTLLIVAEKPKSIPQGSYRKLYEWLSKSTDTEQRKRAEQLGRFAAQLVTSTSWFLDFRSIRDSLVHRGSYTLVFGGPEDGTLFQVFNPDHIAARVKEQVFFVNPNVADFELYSAYWLTRLLLFLEGFATVIVQTSGLSLTQRSSRLYSGGLDTVCSWMDRLVEKLSVQP